MNKKVLYIGIMLFIATGSVFSQSGEVTLSVLPTLALPLGPTLSDGLQFYSTGGGATLRGELVPSFSRNIFGRAFLDYEMLPINGSDTKVSFVYGGIALGAAVNPAPRLSLRASGGGGMYIASTTAGSVRNPFVESGAEGLVRFTPTMSASLGARYKYLFTPDSSLYQGISIQLGLAYDLAGSKKGTEIRIAPELRQIFPLFYSYYDKNSFGETTLTNNENLAIEKVKVEFFAKQYMDNPKLCANIDSLAPGAAARIPVYGLFNDSIFGITEGTKTAGELTVEYYYLGSKKTQKVPVTLQIQNRNAMTWDDDRKAAAFVTAKDPQILGFAKGIASMVRMDKKTPTVSSEFRTALAVYQALREFGVGYAIDPSTPFVELSGSESSVDFLQFPSQTLNYRAGDCDDLSVLYASLLESVGIETALVTTPGHIFVAFNTGVSAENGAKIFSDPRDVIIRNDSVWLPVEVTLIQEGFLRSWTTGAAEWHRTDEAKTARLYPVREAWKTYEPVGFSVSGIAITMPNQDKLKTAYETELMRFSRAQIDTRVANLQNLIKTGKEADKNLNRLGVLYAQYGMMAEARSQFTAAIKLSNLKGAVINMGNIEYLDNNLAEAKKYFERALVLSPGNSLSLVGLARTNQALGNTVDYRATVAQLEQSDPPAASKYFSGTVNTARASDAEERRVDQWTE